MKYGLKHGVKMAINELNSDYYRICCRIIVYITSTLRKTNHLVPKRNVKH